MLKLAAKNPDVMDWLLNSLKNEVTREADIKRMRPLLDWLSKNGST